VYLFYFVVYAALFDVLYGVATVLVLAVPVLGLAVASTFMNEPKALNDAVPGLMMLFILPWKAGTLWSAAQASRRAAQGESFWGAMRGTLADVRMYLTLVPIVGRVFMSRTAAKATTSF
jgi:hypothetical protein